MAAKENKTGKEKSKDRASRKLGSSAKFRASTEGARSGDLSSVPSSASAVSESSVAPDSFAPNRGAPNRGAPNGVDWEREIERYQNLIAEDPHNAEFHKELGNAFHRTEQYELALEEYRTSLHIDPGYFPAHYNMGNTYWKMGDYHQAIICWQKAFILNPKLEHAIYNIAFAYYRLGTTEDDREKSQHHLDNAVLEFKNAIAMRPDNTDSHLHLGLTWFELERYDEAITEFKTVLELDEDDRFAHYNLGNVYYELGQHDASFYQVALGEYQTSIQKNPDDQKSRNNIADCFLRMGDLPAALKQIDAVLFDNPSYIPARCTRGEIFSAMGRIEDAIREFRLVLQLDPVEHRVLHRYVSHQLLELYKIILDRGGATPRLYFNLAKACKDVGIMSGDRSYILKGRDIMRQAIDSMGSRIEFHLLLGEIYMLLTQYDFALMEAERCLIIDSDSVQAHGLLNEIYVNMGERDLAIQEIQTVRRLMDLERERAGDLEEEPSSASRGAGATRSRRRRTLN